MKSVIYLAVAVGLVTSCARADEWNKKIAVTVKKPVQVPGKVLEPGDYIFRLQDSLSNRNIVQIYNSQENHLYQTVQAFPDYRLTPRPGVTIQLEERPVGQPEAIKAVFFPGDNYGQEFVYPPAAAETAIAVTKQPVAISAERAAPTPPPAPAAPAPQATPAPPPAAAPPPAPAPQALPHTASNQPLIALLGLLSLAAAFGLRKVRRNS